MKKLILLILVCTVLCVSALRAQNPENITGTWQGALKAPNGQQLRIVFKFSVEDDKLKAVMYSIDQRSSAIPANTFTREGANIKLTIAAISGTYEGKISPDGKSITGTFTQGAPLPLTLEKATPETAWAIPEPPPPPVRMAADANPTFEVATIKPSKPGTPGKLFTVRGVEVLTVNTSLSDILSMSYDLHPKQIVNAPDWVDSDKYDVTGKPDVPGQPSGTQFKTMLQKLAADRFQLKFHREKRDMSAYVISVAKTGAKLSPSAADPNSLPGLFFQGPGRFTARNATLAEFAQVMQGTALDRPVVDQSGLTGRYDFTLNWTPDEFQFPGLRGPNGGQLPPPPPPPPGTTEAPDLFTAIQQQLGLKLDSMKAPVDVIVIDHVEKPSEN